MEQRSRSRRAAVMFGLVDDGPKPTWRQVRQALYRTLPVLVIVAVLAVVLERRGAPAWTSTLLAVAPVWFFVGELQRQGRDREAPYPYRRPRG